MKYCFLFIPVIILFAFGCSKNSNALFPLEEINYRRIAYESLSEQSKATVISWQKGKVEQGIYKLIGKSNVIILDSGNKIIFSPNTSNLKLTNGQRLIIVTFNTKDDPVLGPMLLIIDPYIGKVIGGVQRM